MSNKVKYTVFGVNLLGWVIISATAGPNFWSAMLGLLMVDASARALGRYDK